MFSCGGSDEEGTSANSVTESGMGGTNSAAGGAALGGGTSSSGATTTGSAGATDGSGGADPVVPGTGGVREETGGAGSGGSAAGGTETGTGGTETGTGGTETGTGGTETSTGGGTALSTGGSSTGGGGDTVNAGSGGEGTGGTGTGGLDQGSGGTPATTGRPTEFVTTSGTQFAEGGRRHLVKSTNFWACMNLGMESEPGDRARLGRELDAMRARGITNVRVMAATEGPDSEPYRIVPALMTAPGVYNEDVFVGLDYCLDEISKRGMRAVMVLNNYWEWSGGMAQYVSWARGTSIPYMSGNSSYFQYIQYASSFFSCDECMAAYRDNVQTIVQRVNTLSGIPYRDDPAIFAWGLANEPRSYSESWPNEMGAFIKSFAPNHMVTVCSEGNWSEDYVMTHQGENIDYGTVHIWPENNGAYRSDDSSAQNLQRAIDYAISNLEENEALSTQLGKPLILEEIGLARDGWTAGGKYDPAATTTNRDAFLQDVYAWIEENVANGGTMAGDGFWSWGGEARPPSVWTGDPPHETPGWYSVYDADESTLGIIEAHTAAMAGYEG